MFFYFLRDLIETGEGTYTLYTLEFFRAVGEAPRRKMPRENPFI